MQYLRPTGTQCPDMPQKEEKSNSSGSETETKSQKEKITPTPTQQANAQKAHITTIPATPTSSDENPPGIPPFSPVANDAVDEDLLNDSKLLAAIQDFSLSTDDGKDEDYVPETGNSAEFNSDDQTKEDKNSNNNGKNGKEGKAKAKAKTKTAAQQSTIQPKRAIGPLTNNSFKTTAHYPRHLRNRNPQQHMRHNNWRQSYRGRQGPLNTSFRQPFASVSTNVNFPGRGIGGRGYPPRFQHVPPPQRTNYAPFAGMHPRGQQQFYNYQPYIHPGTQPPRHQVSPPPPPPPPPSPPTTQTPSPESLS